MSWHFEYEELEALQDPTAAHYARERRRGLYARYQQLHRHIRTVVKGTASEAVRARGGVAEHVRVWTSFDAYAWAVAIVGSRALSLRGDMYLVPFADMISYRPNAAYREAHSGEYFLRYHRLAAAPGDDPATSPKSAFEVLADRPLSRGGVVAEDYGDVPTSVFLHHHGFLPSPNPFDCVQLTVPPLRSPLPAAFASGVAPYADRAALAQVLQVPPLASTCVRAGALSLPALQYFNLRYLTADAHRRCMAAARSHSEQAVDVVRKACLSNRGLAPGAMAEIAHIANTTLAQFKTTAPQDAAGCDGGGGGAAAMDGPLHAALKAAFCLKLSDNER